MPLGLYAPFWIWDFGGEEGVGVSTDRPSHRIIIYRYSERNPATIVVMLSLPSPLNLSLRLTDEQFWPKGGDRSPDAAWVSLAQWNALTPEQQERFLPLRPDFVVELRSPSDALPTLQAKMREYQDNGAKLGLLLDPQRLVVEVYGPEREPKCLTAPSSVDCGETLPGFTLQLDEIF
ncbi:MAG: Uma2 family endonuclease [Leptolyngbyaceae bacterium]|nr:Uma2 family endonuclease [Leptolyngbyaceae bacterium]